MARDARLQLSWNPSLGNLFMEVTMKGILNMVLEVNQIAGKYISKLEQKKFLKVVKLNDATSAIKQAVDDAASIAKKDIIEAVEPLKNKIAQKDEFISNQKITNQVLQNQYDKLQQTNSSLQTELAKEKYGNQTLYTQNENLQTELKKYKHSDNITQKTVQELYDKNSALKEKLKEHADIIYKYTDIVKEAYKQGITPEIREQKSGIANILTGLIQNLKAISKPKASLPTVEEKINIANAIKKRKKERINLASSLIKDLFGDVAPDNFDMLWKRYENLRATNFSEIKNNPSKRVIADTDTFDSKLYILFNDKENDNPLLSVVVSPKDKLHSFNIFDENFNVMINSIVKDGVINKLKTKKAKEWVSEPFQNIAERNIKPWDFSMLNNYIK